MSDSNGPDHARDHIVVLPGGGYARHAPHEAEPVAEWLRSLGVTASVLRYPVATRHPGPLDAVRAHIADVRQAGARRVGVLGFSAGGHLAGHAAATGLVDLAVLGYPVVSMLTPTHASSRQNLLGPRPWPWQRRAVSVERLVTPAMPPTFVWHTADDEVVPVEHAYLLAAALARHQVPHALHVYPTGRHGLGLAEGSGDPERWTAECAAFLAAHGWGV